MKKLYIHSAVSVSAQDTFDSNEFLAKPILHSEKKINALQPDYKEFISPIASRRMASGVKMGFSAAKFALEQSGLLQPDAIITGTGIGCIENTEKFLNTLISNNEEFLTPTSFIQSTHNTVGAQIALGLECKAYNTTYVHGALSFESALMDAQLMLQQEEAQHILVGGVEELGTEFVDYVQMMEDQEENGIKVPFGEGASFFVMSTEQKQNAVQLRDVESLSSASAGTIIEKLKDFLTRNELSSTEIDAVVFGKNGDGFDMYYDELSKALFSSTLQLAYKHLSGEFYTASAFGFWIAHEVLKTQKVPKTLITYGEPKKDLKNILLYNQFKGRDHSFTLLSR